MLSREGRLLAWLAAFEGRLQGVHPRQYEWHESERCWGETGPVIDGGFWPLQEPQAVAPDAWVMAGFLVTEGNLPAVARAAEPGGSAWTLHCIQREDTAPAWSESAVIRWQDRLINVSRHGPTRRLYWAESDDGGRTWSPARPTDLPFADTKPCAGVLADGRPYLIGTTSADTVMRRDPLTLAVGPAGVDPGFDQVWSLRPAVLPGEIAVESHTEALLSYAHAVERDGHLYVAYSNTGGRPGANLNSIELAVVPLADLGE
jgi:hypothetical protein